ncbi:hypothetical protein B6U96_12535 [Archaeoglobales archaeon ex4484_92]|nr:MAG: hypothetical protein B6U96_12535 [Archaeoglobales archaeon ex4484_92]
MKVEFIFVGFNKDNKIIEVKKKCRYSELLESIGINPETVVLVKDDTPIPTDDCIEEGRVKVIRVISGG